MCFFVLITPPAFSSLQVTLSLSLLKSISDPPLLAQILHLLTAFPSFSASTTREEIVRATGEGQRRLRSVRPSVRKPRGAHAPYVAAEHILKDNRFSTVARRDALAGLDHLLRLAASPSWLRRPPPSPSIIMAP